MKPNTRSNLAWLCLLTGTFMASCGKSDTDTLSPLSTGEEMMAATTPRTLLSNIKDLTTSEQTVIQYNSLRNPVKILRYKGTALTTYDTLLYGKTNRLFRITTYKPGAVRQGHVDVTWNTAGKISKKTTYDLANKVLATLTYTYNSLGIATITGTVTGQAGYIKATTIFNEQRNITKATYTGAGVTYGYTLYTAYDTRISPYALHPLLPYLLSKSEDSPVYNRNNATQTTAVYYSALGNLTTTEKSTYTYNSKLLPTKVVSVRTGNAPDANGTFTTLFGYIVK
jgi:hypothetical protein